MSELGGARCLAPWGNAWPVGITTCGEACHFEPGICACFCSKGGARCLSHWKAITLCTETSCDGLSHFGVSAANAAFTAPAPATPPSDAEGSKAPGLLGRHMPCGNNDLRRGMSFRARNLRMFLLQG
jgi:hypothetical protein